MGSTCVLIPMMLAIEGTSFLQCLQGHCCRRKLHQQEPCPPFGSWWSFLLRLQRGRFLGPRKGQPCHSRRRKHHQACCHHCRLCCCLQDTNEHWIDHWILYRHCRYPVVLLGHERFQEISIFFLETATTCLSQGNEQLRRLTQIQYYNF